MIKLLFKNKDKIIIKMINLQLILLTGLILIKDYDKLKIN